MKIDKLKLEHIAGYLPYGLMIKYFVSENDNDTFEMTAEDIMTICNGKKNRYTPLLRPLSQLTRQELLNGGFTSHLDYLTHEKGDPMKAPYEMVRYLLSKHYDIFGLIQNNLAIEKI